MGSSSVQLPGSIGLLDRLISPLNRQEATGAPDGDGLRWRSLAPASQLYVTCVIAVAAIWAAARFPVTVPNPILFITLLAVSCVTSVWKVTLPLPAGGDSTLSVSYAANLAALLLLGPRLAMVVVDHDMAFILPLSDQVVVLNAGELLFTGTPQAMREDKMVQQAYLGTTV